VSLKLLTLNEAEIFVKRAEGTKSRGNAARDAAQNGERGSGEGKFMRPGDAGTFRRD
jgi:hypothetical protein